MNSKYTQILTKDFLKKEYIYNKKSSLEISSEIGCTKVNVLQWLKKFNIKRRKVSELNRERAKFVFGDKHPSYIDGRTKKDYFCEECGKKITIYHNKCKSCWAKSRTKEQSPAWQGGLSFEEYGREFDHPLKEKVRFRDGYLCRMCGCSQLESGQQLSVHHIDYNKTNNVLNNLISLCRSCHTKTNFNRKRWRKYFKIFDLT